MWRTGAATTRTTNHGRLFTRPSLRTQARWKVLKSTVLLVKRTDASVRRTVMPPGWNEFRMVLPPQVKPAPAPAVLELIA